MKQEEKELLIKDLCARLPYKVKLETLEGPQELDLRWLSINMCNIASPYLPYLFPLSSMTDELWDKEFRGCGITEFTRDSFKYGIETLELDNSSTDFSNIVKFISQLIKHHFDIYGLIPMGLALDATGLNIY